ncbi:MAG TPA: hypothetical protein VG228_07165 [Solirubrobacteraceae bacterium]|jgi:hypothetical protein|nr:hypothetical protein [Solirubrobacteraceae bacterium]
MQPNLNPFNVKTHHMPVLHHQSNPARNRMLRLSAVLAAAALVCSAATAGARQTRASQPVATSRVTVTGTALRTVPTSFLGLSMNVEEMEDYTTQSAFPSFIRLITPQGDGPFVLRVGGTFADSAYWNGETSQVAPQYLAPSYDRVTLNDAWLGSLASVVRATSGSVILNVDAADHDPQMALNLVQAAERDLPAGSLTSVAIGNEPNLYSLGYDGINKTNASWVKNFGPVRYDTLFSLYANLLRRHLPSLTLDGPELSSPSAPWLGSLLQHDSGQVGMATEHYYAYNACVAVGSSNYPALHKYFRATNISQATSTMAPAIAAAHNAGLQYRLTELGSSTCLGLPAVTDTFATSLWGLDQLYELVAAGVDGVNFHLRANEPNSAIHAYANVGLSAEPLLYGIAAFSSTLGPNAQLDQVNGVLPSNIRVWAVQSDNGYSLALINDNLRRERVRVAMPTSTPMTVRALTAPSPYAQTASFGGQTISNGGQWQGSAETQTITPVTGDYWFTIPPDSAVIATTR